MDGQHLAVILKAIADSEERQGKRIDAMARQQEIANGRTTKLERATAALKVRVTRLSDRGSLIGSLSAAQKAKLATIGVAVAGAVAEGIHRLIPTLIALLAKAAQ